MFTLIQKLFIPNYKDTKDKTVRERYGVVMSIFCIVCNCILVVFKLIVSFISNSLSIRADALNNLSDMGSNIASLLGFKVASKHPDSEHPYGHGRAEYVSGLIIGFLIVVAGLTSLLDSIKSIFNKADMSFNYIAVIVVLFSILVKLVMGYTNKKAGKLIQSETLEATSQDSFNDALLTATTLISLLVYKFFNLNIDAYVGSFVNIIVTISGIKISIDLISILIGKSPDKELIKEIKKVVMDNPEVIGIHDMIFHDYGPGSRFVTLHAEVDASKDFVYLHDCIDNIENMILGKYGVLATIHMDPVVLNDEELNKYKDLVLKVIKEMNPKYSIHDFRIVKGPSHTNLVFDLLLPVDDDREHSLIRSELNEKVRAINPNLNLSIKIEHGFIA